MATETTVIRLNPDPDAPVSWIVVDEVGARPSSLAQGSLDEAAAATDGRRVTVLVPADQVWRGRVTLPVKGTSRILQALPFALEDQLADDVESLHFAARPGGAPEVEAAAVPENLIQDWLLHLESAGISPRQVVSEIDAVDHIPGSIVIFMDEARLLIRLADGQPLIGERENLESLLDLCLSETDDEESVDGSSALALVIYCSEEQYASESALWDRLRERVPELDLRILPDGALPRLASRVVGAEVVNLRQGAYAPQSTLTAYWPAWRTSAALLAACVALILITGVVSIVRLQQQEAELDEAIAQAFAYTFPGAGEVRDPRRQFDSLRLAAGDTGAAGPGMLTALNAVSKAMLKESDATVVSIGFRSGVMDLRLVVPDVDTLDRVRQSVAEAADLSAEIQSANPDDGKVEGRLQLRLGQT